MGIKGIEKEKDEFLFITHESPIIEEAKQAIFP
jgi:hypothetical protein